MPRSCEAAHEDSKVEAQRGERFITELLITDPWSKGDYSRHIREASMAIDGLPEGVLPSGKVPGQLLQAAPILKRWWRRYRGEFAKIRSILGVSTPRAKYRRRGAPGGPTRGVRRVHARAPPRQGPTRQSGGSLAWPRVGPRQLPSWLAGGGPLPSLGSSGSFWGADFLSDFSGFF